MPGGTRRLGNELLLPERLVSFPGWRSFRVRLDGLQNVPEGASERHFGSRVQDDAGTLASGPDRFQPVAIDHCGSMNPDKTGALEFSSQLADRRPVEV